MSSISHELTQGIYDQDEGLPQELREACVNETILSLRLVAESESDPTFIPLPTLLEDSVEIAYELTSANVIGQQTSDEGDRVVFHLGRYEGQQLEFAASYRATETGEELNSWGVRRASMTDRSWAAAKMSRSAIDGFVEDVLADLYDLETTEERDIPRAA